MLAKSKHLEVAALIGLQNINKFKLGQVYMTPKSILKNTPALKQSAIETDETYSFNFSTLRLVFNKKTSGVLELDRTDIIVYDNLGNNIFQGSLEEIKKLVENYSLYSYMVTTRHNAKEYEKLSKDLKNGSFNSFKRLTDYADAYDMVESLTLVELKKINSFFKTTRRNSRTYGFEYEKLIDDEITFYRELTLTEMEFYYEKM